MAADEIPIIQVLDRTDASKQTMVPLPNTLPLQPLTAPSSIRLRSEIIGITSNVFTYCRLGDAAGYYNYHPLPEPPILPEPYASDPSKYAMTNCWGYGRVLSSTLPSRVPEGSFLYGYLPISTLPQDLPIADADHPAGPDRILVTAPHRQPLMPFYQSYTVVRPGTPLHDTLLLSSSSSTAHPDDSLGNDSIFGCMAGTAHLLANHVFAPSPTHLINPYADPVANPWTLEGDADLSSATLVCFAPGSKTSLSFVHNLRGRPDPTQRPARIVGVASPHSRAFVLATGLYDAVLDTSDPKTLEDPRRALVEVGGGTVEANNNKIVVVDFGGRGGSALKFAAGLRDAIMGNVEGKAPADKLRLIRVGIEIAGGAPLLRGGGNKKKKEGGESAKDDEDDDDDDDDDEAKVAAFTEQMNRLTESVNGILVNTADLRLRAAEKVGDGEVEEATWRNWEGMKKKGQAEEGGSPVKGFKLRWGKGMGDVEKGWGEMVRDEVPGDTGLAFKL